MILFYSDYCKHCRMLIDTIQRMQSKGIKMVSVDSYRANNLKIPSQIHSVPALLLMPSKELLFGKQVFDYLLLPGKGILTLGLVKSNSDQEKQGEISHNQQIDPDAFSLIVSNLSGDNFSFIDTEDMDNNRSYVWTSIQDIEESQQPNVSNDDSIQSMQTSTRVKKETLDIEEFKARRAEDLNLVINTMITEPPSTTY